MLSADLSPDQHERQIRAVLQRSEFYAGLQSGQASRALNSLIPRPVCRAKRGE